MRVATCQISAVAVVIAVTVLAACGGGSGATKAGGTSKPITLTVGTPDTSGHPAPKQIAEFARQVDRLSNGKIHVKTVFHAGGFVDDEDQAVAAGVKSGKLQMALVAARAWDTEGVTSLRALNAPFLVTSNDLVHQVISGSLAGPLMSGLPKAGVTGVAMFPEDLRHPFGLEQPLYGPDDYAGKVIRSPRSKTVAATFHALGAKTTGADPDAGAQDAMESGFQQDVTGTVTGNVTFFPKVNVLVINDRVLAELDKNQAGILRQAAAQTRAWAIANNPTDAEGAASFCGNGYRVVMATGGQLAALESAEQPVIAELERDPLTKSLIERIGALKQQSSNPEQAAHRCGSTAGAQKVAAGDKGSVDAVDGVYRSVITDKLLRSKGVTDQSDIDENHGVITYTLKGGHYCWTQKSPTAVANPDECGTYEIEGNRMTWNFPTGPPDIYTWSKTPSGDLKLTLIRTTPDAVGVVQAFLADPWKRIGDAK